MYNSDDLIETIPFEVKVKDYITLFSLRLIKESLPVVWENKGTIEYGHLFQGNKECFYYQSEGTRDSPKQFG